MENIEYKGYTIEIEQDQFAEDSRNWDNIGKMVCFHKRYNLGDTHDYNQDNYTTWKELEKAILKEEKPVALFPLYLYDHSGLRIKRGSFEGLLPQGHAEFDSGMVGYIYATRAKVLEEFGVKRVSSELLREVRKILNSEIDIYNQYLAGDVWDTRIVDRYGEEIDSMGGQFGYLDAIDQAKSNIDAYIASEKPKARDKSILSRLPKI